MTSVEFTLWLKGFVTACNDYSPTPKQWDTIKEELNKVSDNVGTPYTTGADNPNLKITTTPGTTGYVTIHNPTQFGVTGSATYNQWTTTRWNPSGSNWNYTLGGNKDIKE